MTTTERVSRGGSRSWLPRGWVERARTLRTEEIIFWFALLPSTAMTVWANLELDRAGISSRKIEGGLLRLAIAVLLAAALPALRDWTRTARRGRSTAEFLSTMLPFVLCIAVYTNLHDTVRFVNPHDIDPWLVATEQWIFGGLPNVWAQQFITPARTDVFSAFYASFVLIAPSVVLVLWISGRKHEARDVLLSVVVCFYTGYVLYVIFPATPPRLYLQAHGFFDRALTGGPATSLQQAMIEMMPRHASRAAFPSLHAAVSILNLYFCWRYCRWFFPILFAAVAGLLVSTVYLRHHYVVDLLAGMVLVPWAPWAAQRLDAWWSRMRRVEGLEGLDGDEESKGL